jgi:hypothetical protein
MTSKRPVSIHCFLGMIVAVLFAVFVSHRPKPR